MRIEQCEQGTQDWFDARNGRVTASRIKDVTAYLKPTKDELASGLRREKQTRADYRTEIVTETLLGSAIPHVVTEAMRWGIAQEAMAATEYELESPESVRAVGFVYHPSIERAGASPDRLVGKDGLLEIKCPNTTTHIEWALAGVVPDEHKPQMYFQMRCCEREWCDFMSFDSRLPEPYQKFVRRLYPDDAIMDGIDDEVIKFLAETDATLALLRETFKAAEPKVAADALSGLGLGLTDEEISKYI